MSYFNVDLGQPATPSNRVAAEINLNININRPQDIRNLPDLRFNLDPNDPNAYFIVNPSHYLHQKPQSAAVFAPPQIVSPLHRTTFPPTFMIQPPSQPPVNIRQIARPTVVPASAPVITQAEVRTIPFTVDHIPVRKRQYLTCVICKESYEIHETQRHLEKHRRSVQAYKPNSSDIPMVKLANQSTIRPLIEPQQVYVDNPNRNVFVLQKLSQIKQPVVITSARQNISVSTVVVNQENRASKAKLNAVAPAEVTTHVTEVTAPAVEPKPITSAVVISTSTPITQPQIKQFILGPTVTQQTKPNPAQTRMASSSNPISLSPIPFDKPSIASMNMPNEEKPFVISRDIQTGVKVASHQQLAPREVKLDMLDEAKPIVVDRTIQTGMKSAPNQQLGTQEIKPLTASISSATKAEVLMQPHNQYIAPVPHNVSVSSSQVELRKEVLRAPKQNNQRRVTSSIAQATKVEADAQLNKQSVAPVPVPDNVSLSPLEVELRKEVFRAPKSSNQKRMAVEPTQNPQIVVTPSILPLQNLQSLPQKQKASVHRQHLVYTYEKQTKQIIVPRSILDEWRTQQSLLGQD